MTLNKLSADRGTVIQGKFIDGRPRGPVAAPSVRLLTCPLGGAQLTPLPMPHPNPVAPPTRAQRQDVPAHLKHQTAHLERMAQAKMARPRAVDQQARPSPHAAHQGSVVQRIGHGHAVHIPRTVSNCCDSSGQPLPAPVRKKMEACFGTSFADVRVHAGPQASSIGALAFTRGSHLYFAPGQYNPHTPHGQQILGHELAHVVQQRAGRVRNPFGSGIAVVRDYHLDAEADRMGFLAANHPATHTTQVIQRAARVDAPVRPNVHSLRLTAPRPGRLIQRKCDLCHSKDHETDACPGLKDFQQRLTITSSLTVDQVQQAGKEVQARYVASKIRSAKPIAAIDYTTVQEWADWYFPKLSYQNNATGGWHENRHDLLEGGTTAQGRPTRYVEFRCEGATYGLKDFTKLERCIFDLYTQRVYPNAHYDKGYVEIANVPLATKKRLWNLAIVANDATQRYQQAAAMNASSTDKIKHTFQIQ